MVIVVFCIALEILLILAMLITAIIVSGWRRVQIWRNKVKKTRSKPILENVWVLPKIMEEEKTDKVLAISLCNDNVEMTNRSTDEYFMPDSGRENGQKEVNRLQTRDAVIKNELGTSNGKKIGRVEKRKLGGRLDDASPIYSLVLNHLIGKNVVNDERKKIRT